MNRGGTEKLSGGQFRPPATKRGYAPARIKSFHLGYLVFCSGDGKGLEGRVMNDLPVASQNAPPPVCGRASSHHPSALIRGNTSVVSLHISGAPKIMCIGAPTAAAISETNRSIRRILHGFTAKNHTSIRPPTCLKICRLSVMDKEQPVKDSIYPCRIIQVQIVPRQTALQKPCLLTAPYTSQSLAMIR